MVTDEKVYSTALIRYRLGTVLIWLGVLTWLPFILLRIVGEKPSLFWYLPFHLLGVVGGSRLRTFASREMSIAPTQKSRLQMLGHGMIFCGVLVWAPYFYVRVAVQQPVEVMDFLPYHLAGVFGGITLLGISYWISQKEDRKV